MVRGALVAKLQRLWPYFRSEWQAIGWVLLLSLLLAGCAALQPWPLKVLIDQGLGTAPVPTVIAQWAAVIGMKPHALLIGAAALAALGLVLLTVALDAALTLIWARAGQRMVYALSSDVFLRLQQLSLRFHAQREVGDSLSRVTADSWSVYTAADGLLIVPLKELTALVAIGAVAWQLEPQLALMMLIAVPLVVATVACFGAPLKASAASVRAAVARLTAFSHQCLGAIPAVQVFGAERRNGEHFGRFAERAVTAERKMALVDSGYALMNGGAITLGIAVVVYAGGERVLAQQMSVGTLLVFVAYMHSLEGSLRKLLTTYGSLRHAEASIDRVLEVLDSTQVVSESPTARPLPPTSAGGLLVFDRVTLGHTPERIVLRQLSLEVRRGEVLALVGMTGSGKSTLVSAVLRFIDPSEGRVLLDGIDLRELKVASLREQVALVLQEPFLLALSVAENIAYGRPDADRDDIVAAAVAANAHEFISRLPQGYDTVLGERGGGLSGGQQQRISIARAFLKNARVVVLDEPTSALDQDSERAVMEALRRLMVGRTTLIVSHRLSTIRYADRIAVLGEGTIQELGTHDELLARQGPYSRLHAAHCSTTAEASR